MVADNEIITLTEKKRTVLSPERFLRLTSQERENIARTRIVPPELGKPGFGGLEVEYLIPVYEQ